MEFIADSPGRRRLGLGRAVALARELCGRPVVSMPPTAGDHTMQVGMMKQVKQKLAAVRMLYDFLVVRQITPSNPAHSVRGPKYVVKKGKTPVWSREDAKTLLDSIPKDSVSGLRDLALIAAMFYSFARVSAVLKLKVDDYYHNGVRRRLRLHEKGGKEHEMPVHHLLEQILNEYI
jgi:site-specific recombinase XerD